MNYINHKRKFLADLTTPVALYLKIRERYGVSVLLESSDYSSKEDSHSFIAFDSISTLMLKHDKLTIDNESKLLKNLPESVNSYLNNFSFDKKSTIDGVFGFTAFDAIYEFEDLDKNPEKLKNDIATVRYDFFKYIFIFDHFHNTIELVEHCPEGEESNIDQIASLLAIQDHQTFSFETQGNEETSLSDSEYMNLVTKAKAHCQRGDIFQMVLSRQYEQRFKGDEFNVYRALRSINPSPYLFYFDYGSYKIFGSSPEAQLKINNGIAEIHPIAGTIKRTGDDARDQALAKKLLDDPKENAEHVMLVDLARNDLSRNTTDVKVEAYKKVQFFSHVIHLVSLVTGQMQKDSLAYKVFADTFPAGTLSGAPKHKALQLIQEYEPIQRDFYGGAIGYLGFDGSINHAIIIRSFLSIASKLICQAGAGLVIDSIEKNELKEVNNKLAALKKALQIAQEI